MGPGTRGVFEEMADRTGLTIALTSTSIAETPEWGGTDPEEWKNSRGTSNADQRNTSEVPGAFRLGGEDGDAIIAVAADHPQADEIMRHEMSHAIDAELGHRLTGGDAMFSAQDEFAAFYMRMLEAFDASGLVENPNFKNTVLIKPYYLHKASGQTHHNGTHGRSEFFAESHALAMHARQRIASGEDRDAVALDVAASLTAIPNDATGPATDRLRAAGTQILDYFDDLEARLERGGVGRGESSPETADRRAEYEGMDLWTLADTLRKRGFPQEQIEDTAKGGIDEQHTALVDLLLAHDAGTAVPGEWAPDVDYLRPGDDLSQAFPEGDVFWVPVERLKGLEGNEGGRAGENLRDDVSAMAKDMREKGIRADNHLVVEYNPETGALKLGEGNHRLRAAMDAGIDRLPVRVATNKFLKSSTTTGAKDVGTYVKPDGYRIEPERYTGDQVRQILGYTEADTRRTITTGRRDATKTIRKNDLSNPDSTHADLLNDEEKSAMSRALKEAYGIEPLQMVRNIVEAFGMSTKREREFGGRWYSDAFDYAKGLRDKYRADGMTLEKAAAMLAALSPQTRWGLNKLHGERLMQVFSENPELDADLLERNLQYSDNKGGVDLYSLKDVLDLRRKQNKGGAVLDDFGKGKRLMDLDDDRLRELAALLVRADTYGEFRYDNPTSEGDSVGKVYSGSSPMKNNFDAALQIWRAEPGDLQAISTALGGHKVRSFYNNIIHDPASGEPDRSITVDTHAIDTAILGALAARLGLKAGPKPTPRAATLMRKYDLEFPEGGWFDGEKFLKLSAMDGVKFLDQDKARQGTYAMFHEAFRRATEEINAQLGTDYTPKQIQAIVWLTSLDDAVWVDHEDVVQSSIERWNHGLSNVRPASALDIEDFKQRTNSKWKPEQPFRTSVADNKRPTAEDVWLAPTDTGTDINPLEKSGRKTEPPDVDWNSLDGLEDGGAEWATTLKGVSLEPMPEPGTPAFEAMAAEIRKIHGAATALPTKNHRLAFIHPDWRSPDVHLLWRGYSKQGAQSRGYSSQNDKRGLFQRFARVQRIAEETPRVRAELVRRAEAGDETALAALLIMDTGMRVGSGKGGTGTTKDKKTGKMVTTYGGTSLQQRHLQKRQDGTYYWRFPGKGNVTNTYDVTEPILKQKMSEWYSGGSGTGRIWSEKINDRRIAAMLSEIYGFDVKNHDMRRQHATLLAKRLIAERVTPPRSPKVFEKARKGVAEKVAYSINDTVGVALKNYIDWSVWADWEESAGLTPTMERELSELADLVGDGAGETADTVIASAFGDGADATPGLDVDGPGFQDFLDFVRNAFLTVEEPTIAEPWLDVPDEDGGEEE